MNHSRPFPVRPATADAARSTLLRPGMHRDGPAATAIVANGTARLDDTTRHTMEQRLGADFSRVRVHTGAEAARQAGALGAKAFAAGEDIVFAAGRYRPRSHEGTRLLAHELAHVAQQQRGGSASPVQAETQARHAADRVVRGEAVPPQALGGAATGVYCEPDDDKGKEPQNTGSSSVLPPMPNLQLKTLPPIDWLKMRSSFDSRGQRLSLRDAGDMAHEWDRSSAILDTLGIDDRFKLWFITKQWILNKGLSMQLDDRFTRENPNSWDRFDRDWKNANPGAWQTPIFPIFDIDWFRSSKKKK